jgi:hypothetical protein
MAVNISTTTPPPVVGRSTRTNVRSGSVAVAAPQTPTQKREESLNTIAQLLGLGATMLNWDADARAITTLGPPVNHEIAVIADNNEKLAATLDKLETIGPYGALIIPLMALSLQVAANHGLVNPNVGFGVRHPDQLRAEMQAEKLKMARQAMAMQKELEEERAQYIADMQSMNGDGTSGTPEDSE